MTRCRKGLLPPLLGHGTFPAPHIEGSPPAPAETSAPRKSSRECTPQIRGSPRTGHYSGVRGQCGKPRGSDSAPASSHPAGGGTKDTRITFEIQPGSPWGSSLQRVPKFPVATWARKVTHFPLSPAFNQLSCWGLAWRGLQGHSSCLEKVLEHLKRL